MVIVKPITNPYSSLIYPRQNEFGIVNDQLVQTSNPCQVKAFQYEGSIKLLLLLEQSQIKEVEIQILNSQQKTIFQYVFEKYNAVSFKFKLFRFIEFYGLGEVFKQLKTPKSIVQPFHQELAKQTGLLTVKLNQLEKSNQAVLSEQTVILELQNPFYLINLTVKLLQKYPFSQSRLKQNHQLLRLSKPVIIGKLFFLQTESPVFQQLSKIELLVQLTPIYVLQSYEKTSNKEQTTQSCIELIQNHAYTTIFIRASCVNLGSLKKLQGQICQLLRVQFFVTSMFNPGFIFYQLEAITSYIV
ncbi:hypothetical protein TTHERM_000189049 (macronuclear) [Tetrahymena thermophila SB210]|uniref:Uncharacterized protein n=1 Tax=Tetrahymena thermophila (strain SB210) TaxID=312017 RepID=W7XCF4_TETTS|nr:hypothetical protein TTHERM_000189049 [Tetrahymena thermophila SB210]EWS74238.1 hypothetical protein TTHERM_000189049 [Tetrahymena thermophila SB210]|eukprot:XP_012653211.1 hypothetical protein TTHERM_000189049 [Tetrahymena thermophila SB210]